MSIGTMLFNPFTGEPRASADIASDPNGHLLWDGKTPLRAMPTNRIVLEDGKYTVVRHATNGSMHALRHGEPWQDLTGNKLIGALCSRIDELTAPEPVPKKPPVRLTMTDGDRYTVSAESNSGHCCFEASAIDTHTPRGDAICECFEKADAEKIAALLNGVQAVRGYYSASYIEAETNAFLNAVPIGKGVAPK